MFYSCTGGSCSDRCGELCVGIFLEEFQAYLYLNILQAITNLTNLGKKEKRKQRLLLFCYSACPGNNPCSFVSVHVTHRYWATQPRSRALLPAQPSWALLHLPPYPPQQTFPCQDLQPCPVRIQSAEYGLVMRRQTDVKESLLTRRRAFVSLSHST